jgi:hypothetical protein
MTAGGFYFCCTKSNKSAFFFFRLLCRTWPLPCKSGRTSGCKQLPHCVRTMPLLQQIFTMPLLALDAISSAWFRPKRAAIV